MAVVSVFFPFNHAHDIHLLPGLMSPRLDHLMFINDSTGVVRADKPPAGVTVAFQALFSGVPPAHGVSFDATTGEIEIAAAFPAGPRLRSFVALCGCSEGDKGFSIPLRVHVHASITHMWITPSVMHVRQGAENMRFALLARFDDGVIGDITNWSPFRRPTAGDRTFVRSKGENVPVLRWSSATPGDVAADEATGVLDCKTAAANVAVTVERRPLPAPATHRAEGRVLGAPPWNTPVRLTPVQGSGFAAMARTRNVLFLPEGFVDVPAEKRQFAQLVRGVVNRLTYRPQTTPFDLLSQSKAFNYFLAWVPSPEPGVTVLNELFRVNIAGNRAEGWPMEEPAVSRSGVAAWNLDELLYEVGPPTPVHDPVGSPLGTDAAGRLKEWRELYSEMITNALVAGVYPDWLERSTRVLLNELDTAFHLAMSYRPRLDNFGTERELTFNPLRTTDADFNRFLGALADDEGKPVGAVWASGGQDQDLVVVLCRSNRNGGSNAERNPTGHLLALTLGKDYMHRVEESAIVPQFDIVDDPIPAETPVALWLTVAHELAHSWAIGDEYGGGGVIDSARADTLVNTANLQARKTLLTGGSLDADKIKWRWPRIAKAGVIAAKPTDTSATGDGPFRVQMVKGHGYQFGKDDIVKLRTRPLATSTASKRLKISRMLADGDVIELVQLPGTVLKVDDFPAGSVLMSPKRAPDNADGTPGDDLELVGAGVRTRMNTTHNPLNAADGDPINRVCGGAVLLTPTGATNFPRGVAPRPPRYSSWIVGLHENGATFDCDVYHPTGVCVMRQQSFQDRVSGRDRAYEFCPVCRYAIVDLLDPTMHPTVEATLLTRYVE
jgi:hypothetical protein